MSASKGQMKVGVVVFPGTNCDQEIVHLYENLLNCSVRKVWHRDTDLSDLDLVVLPGGFAYGDYLRTGALAKLSPVMRSVKEFAAGGGPVLGICNGFQVLCEAGLLPGVLLENVGLRFLSQFVSIKVESSDSFFTKNINVGTVVRCPIAHFQGNYFAEPEDLKQLEAKKQVIFRYSSENGDVDPSNRKWNVNGSSLAIAGIKNAAGNVVGLMPHPERASEALIGWVGADSGLKLFATTAAA